MSVCVNVVLAQAGVVDRSALDGDLPTVLDVSIQLVFVSIGAIAALALVKDQTVRARTIWPMVLCLAALCLIMASQSVSIQDWAWADAHQPFLRIWLPDAIGAMTIGLTVWTTLLRQHPQGKKAG